MGMGEEGSGAEQSRERLLGDLGSWGGRKDRRGAAEQRIFGLDRRGRERRTREGFRVLRAVRLRVPQLL
jgi:hypothetical protein